MHCSGRVSIRARWVVLAALLTPCVGHACSIFYPSVRVGTGFRARVTDRGRPVKALRLVLSKSESPGSKTVIVIDSFTDADGYSTFTNLSPGLYSLSPDHDGGGVSDGAAVEVSANGPANVTVPLKWPSLSPISVRSAAGIVRGPDYYPSQTQIPLSLSLIEGLSAHVVATTLTDSKGRFAFGGVVPAGIYFLRLNPSGLVGWRDEQMEGLMTIEVSGEATDEALDLDIGWSSCGLMYAQQPEYPDITLRKIHGDVADISGAAIANAQILLLATDENAAVVAETRSGKKGQFALQEQHDGVYRLVIRSPGFQPYVRVIHIVPSASDKSSRQPLHLRLEVLM